MPELVHSLDNDAAMAFAHAQLLQVLILQRPQRVHGVEPVLHQLLRNGAHHARLQRRGGQPPPHVRVVPTSIHSGPDARVLRAGTRRRCRRRGTNQASQRPTPLPRARRLHKLREHSPDGVVVEVQLTGSTRS